MKKVFGIIAAVLTIACFIFISCNSPVQTTGPSNTNSGNGEDVVIDNGSGYPLAFTMGGTWVGGTVSLDGSGVGDLSNYSSVIVEGEFLTGASLTPASGDFSSSNMGQFFILRVGGGDWGVTANILGNKKSDMIKSGENTLGITASGMPGFIAIEADSSKTNATHFNVKKITFKPNTGAVALEAKNWLGGSYYSVVNSNTAVFNNATYSEGALFYNFPGSILINAGNALPGNKLPADKNVVFKYKIIAGHNPTLEHQIHIQAADNINNTGSPSYDTFFNGKNDATGQIYITLEDTIGADLSGTFSVPTNRLITASEQNHAKSNEFCGPFNVSGLRILNNGSQYHDGTVNHVRNKTFTLLFESITVQ
jgi:hypothetical protein